MPSLNLTDAWKDYTPPSPPDTAGQTAADTPPAAPAPGARTSFFLSPETTGLLAPGNIDLRSRPVIHNPDGTVSTPRTLSIARDGRQYLIPTVSDEGELLSDQDAITQFEQTGRHLGAFKTLQDATGYANQLHRQQEILYAASPEDFQGWEIQNRPPVSDFPGQAATPLSPARPRTLFDQPLTTPLIPSSTRPAPAFQPDPQRLEQLHALILHSKQDPELDALLETNPAFRAQADLDDGSLPSRALLGQQILREIAGDKYAGEPGFYFLALKEKLPEAATRQEAYAAVYDHYAKAIEKQYQENKTRKAAYQKNRTEVEGAVAKVIGSLWTPADLNTRLTPEQTDVYRKEFDTAAVEKAHAAFSILKQAFSATPEEGLRRMVSERTAMQITSALSDNDGTGKLTISETAFGLFEGALHTLMEETKEQSGDEYKFLHNLRLALFSPVIKRDATLGTLLQINSQQNNLIPFAHEHNDKVLEKTEETLRDYQTYLKNDKENARVLGLLSTGQDLGNSPNERAPFAARTVNCLGSVCGQTAPFFIPYAGWGLALTGAYDDKRNRAYYAGLASGTAEWSAFIDAAASTAVEKISYGALGRLSGAGWLMSKLPFMGKTRKALTDSLWKHVLFETGAGIVEETFIEPTAEAVIQWAVRGGIAPLAGIDAGADYDWNNYWQELKGMLEPDQLLATALFVGGLAGTQSAIMQRSLITHSRSPEMLMSQGIPEAEAKRITQIPDNGERIAAVRNAVARLKTRPPAEVLKNAKKGVKAFQSLAEIRATVESEAYQYFQSAMHLPLVEEKLDKPGTYAVTIFDPHSGQKKFTQEMTGAQLTAHFGQYLKSEQRKIIAKAQSDFAANAFMRTSEAHGAIQTQDMLQWSRQDQENAPKEPESATKKPENKKDSPAPTPASDNPPATQTAPAQTPPAPDTVQETSPPSTATDSSPATAHTDSPAPSENLSALGRFIRTFGSMGQTGFSYLTRVALEEWNRRLASGLSREQAGAAPFAPLSPYAPLNTMLGLEEAFKKRLGIAAGTTGEEKNNQTGLFQMRTAPGTTPADILFLVSKGLVGTREMLEDLFEVGIKNLVKGEPARLEAMGALLRDTQAGLQKLGFPGQFIAPSGPLDEMKVVEAMSKLALSDTLVNAESLPLPQWQKDLLQYHVNYLQDAAWLLDLGHAWNLGREKGTITQDMADILRDLGHIVHTMYDQAKIEQQDIQAVMEARTLTGRLDASGTPAASEIRERQQKDAEEEKNRITTGDRSKERPLPQTALQRPETLTLPQAPATMKGVFVNGASYNPDAGTWLGMVPVDKLHLSPQVPQVKVNSGKKGVVTPLVGDYRADAPPIYVWKRTTGRLEVVSGRHRLDLAQRTGIKAIPAYVYEEDSTHNAQWARLLDYEQNMQDDQADELTAAIYVRETSLTDDELTRRGLTRSGTRSRRGLLIGREAREDLWTRFRSGAITAQNAEAICLLTQHIQDKARIDAMQTTAANDLANGKTLEFVAAKLQLMAHASADGGMVQGLITFGDTFEADMEKAAEYVSRCITTINEHINAIKGVRTISKKGSVLATEGITAGLSADPAERLRELELLKAMYEKIGLYENLRIRALTWDGKTPPDPIGDHRLDMQAERARAEEDAAALENEENRKASEALTPKLTFSLTPSRDLETAFPALWRQAARELNATGQVSFALAGSRIAIHTLSEIKMQRALELGGMPNPAIQIADLDSGPTHYGEIACILHPERIDPARTPGARIFRGDAWTRQMPEKISEDGDLWEGYEHTPEETPWFYDTEDNLLEWNRENLDAYMKAKHLDSFMPHNMTPDEVLDNYGEDGGAFPIIMASQAYAAEFPSLEEAMRTDNLTLQLDRREAETAVRELEQQFKTLLSSCYIEPRSLQKFLIGYWWRDISHENVRNALIGEELLDDPDMRYDQEENPEEYNDLQNSNDDIAEEVRSFLDACRTSTKIYYEAAPGGWLFPSDFSGFILPSSLEFTLGPELEKYGVPILTYHLTAEEALALGNPWALGKAPWLQEAVDERRNEAIREFLEDRDVSFSLSGEEEDRPSPPLDFPSPSSDYPLALSPSRLASSFHAVEKEPPLSISIPQATEADKQGYSKLARKAFISLRTKTRQKDSLPRQSIRRQEELVKPFLSTAESRVIFLGEKDWGRFISSSPDTRTLAVMSALEELIVTARYMYSVPEFDANAPDQTKARHYYLGKVKDNVHGTSLVLLTFREDTRGTYLETLETEKTDSSGNKNGSVSSLTDFGLTHRAARRSLPAPTLHTLKQFVNFIDEQSKEAFYAPNGQPSRLTPDQWHLVRTAPFLRYFGDWLHDPSSSSVVLDANGEPLVCYRGLKQSYNPGVRRNYTWVSTSRDLSEQYAAGGALLDLFISARRPFHFPDGLTRQSPVRFRETIKKELEQDKQRGLITADQYSTAALRLDSLLQGTEETEAFKIWERHRNLKDILAPLGYDSVMTEENGVMTYGLFRPGQAKSAVGNCGTYDITLPDITFSLTPQEQRTTAQALVEDTFLRAPDGTPTALTKRQWLQTNSTAFKKWFGKSKIVNSHGEPVIVYHGTRRADRVGTVFRPDRATSGPMSFFTDNEQIASNYARDKADTSIAYEEENYYDYRQQFRVTLPSGRDVPLINYWRLLPAAEQARITRAAGHIREDDEGETIILDPSTDQANGSFQDHLFRAGGNTFRALIYHWLESGILFNEEYRFLQVLEKLNLPLVPSYRDPDYREPKVYACYMRMENPFRTDRLTRKIITSLKAAAKKAGASREGWRTDIWDKNQIPPQDWIDRLEQDYADRTTTSWTSIPDWVTACLKRQGYDGIIDQGGKFHPEEHTVCIPFSSGQLKSATDNNGAFDPGSPDITFSTASEKRLITLRAKKDGTWLQAPNGKRSLLSPRLWSTVRTRAFRDWFGDWMNDPANASRIVDENGEPMVVYHGSNYKFTEFDPYFAGNNYDRQDLDFGFLFTTTDEYYAKNAARIAREFENERRYARGEKLFGEKSPRQYALFANLRNPLIYDLAAHPVELPFGFSGTEPDVWDNPRFALRAQQEFGEGDDDGKDYDGIILKGKESSWILARQSLQLKSATHNRGTYDAAEPDITFSLWDEDTYTTERAAIPLNTEERSILARARDRGDYMLAPGGQPTRLTEKQWAQVRTKAFLAWYGDWLHDPAKASKTLDENGEPLNLFHGGRFDINHPLASFDDGPGENGIFFSDSPELAEYYRGGYYITTAWLNLKNPFRAQDEASSRLPWVDEYIDYWQEEEGWTDRHSGEAMDREAVRDIIREGDLYDYDSTGNRWRDFLGWVQEHHDGYLGHDPTDMGALIAVAFNSNQVKSSEYNSGAFSAAHRDITFSLSSLAAVHSLNVEKFLAADQLGGLPLPSLAVTRLDKPYTWGGEDNIYLIGSPALADPARGVEIHDRDMWSGHFPGLRWNRREEQERDEFYQSAEAAARRYYGGTDISALRFLKNALDGDHRGALESKLRRNDLSLAVFAGERGYAPRPLMGKTPGRLNTEDKFFHVEIRKMLPEKDANYLHPDRKADFCAAMERAIERYRESSTAPPQTKILRLRLMEKELKEARGEHFDIISYQALQDTLHAGKSVPDWQANYKRFEKYVATHTKAFDAWVQDKMERWLNPMPRIRENGFPATLDNITRYMLGSKGAGMERGIVFSTGLLRAKQSRRFDSQEQVKNSRDDLVTTEENRVSQQKAQDLIHEFQTVLNRIDESFQAFDNAVEALSCVKGEPTQAKVSTALSRLYRGSSYRSRITGNSRLLGLGVAALTALKTELRDYYEAVPQRAVKLEEFSRAVLPAALKKNKQIQDVLKRRHIRPLYHDGTQQGRFQAMASLMGSSVSFSLTPGPSWLRFPTSEDMASLSEEERPIVQKALATGSWLKAPNGENSRLTPRQWAQVRTAAFKNWFGDWETDPAHASRVVDNNGEPRIVYHGTKHAGFTIFDRGKGISSPDTPAGSSFFAADPEVAASYSETQQEVNLRSPLADTRSPGIYPCFLNLRAPLEEDFEGLWWYEKGEPWFDLYDKQSASYINPPDGKLYWTSRQEGIDYAAARGLTDYMLIRIYSSRTVHTVVQEAADAGADGAVIHNVIDGGDKETDIYVSLHPEQIKSATDNIGTFDPASPDITFSVIGPHAATWEQYKKKTFRGRDDGMYRAELDASQAILKNRAAPYLAPLRRELAALRRTLPTETKKQITRYLSLHRQFYKNKRTLNPENNVAKWLEYLALDREEERWRSLLASAILRSGVYRTSPLSASALAAWTSSLVLLLKEDEAQTAALAARAADKTLMTLEEWLDYPELFAAYPALRTMPVIPDFFRGYLGMYSPAERTIYLHQNLDAPAEIRSTLLHEIQHAIQHIEGFAKGGTEESAYHFYQSRKKDAQEAYDNSKRFMDWLNARDNMISTLEYMLSLARNPRRVLRTSYHHSYDGITRRLEGEERLLDMTRYALEDQAGMLEQFYMENWNTDPQFDLPWPGNYHLNTPSGIQDCLTAARATPSRRLAYRSAPKPDMTALSRNLLKYERLSSLSPRELYLRLAGEIESRNVQSRRDWAAERRTTEPFNATLEYPGESLVTFSMTRAENRPAESFLSTLTEEERTLADTAWESGAWLLAPGGQPTRLTPRQWLQVRTAAFKSWFGDWEHDPLAASCVVDDHREPLVVYHGARHAGFSVFDSREGESFSEAPAGSAFFTDDLSVALSYSGTREEPDLLDPSSLEGVYSPPGLYPCFLNLREPWDADFEGANWNGTNQLLFEFYNNETEDFINPPNGGDFWKSEEAIREYAEANSYTDYEIYNVEGHRTTNTIVQDAINMGLDGAVIYNVIDMGSYAKGAEKTSDIYVAFHPKQIKSATQNRGTFDPRHPDITFSLAASLAVQQSITSADTSIRQVARTFGIVRDKLGGWEKGSVNIDIGGGKYDDFTQALEREGVTSYLYDPFARHAAHNAPVLRDLRRGRLKGDTVTCSNVLNVIPEQTARFNVIHQAAKSLKPDGTAWFCVYEGDGTGTGRVTRTRSGMASCWQENRKTASYLEEIRPFFGEVELRHGLIRARAPRRTESPAAWRLGRDTERHASFSLSSLREQGRFTQGMLPVRNALITEPGATFSLAAEHASPYSFRKFKENGKKEEKRTLNYGWGLYFTEDSLKSRAYEKSFRSADDAKEIFYLIDGDKSPASAFLPDEQDMLDEISANGWDNISSYVDRNRDVMELYKIYRSTLDKYRGKTVERIWESLPSSTVSSYRVELNVKEEDLLTWEDHVPSALLYKVLAYIKAPHPDFHAEIMNYPAPANGSGRHVPVKFLCPRLQECLGKKEASKWLLSQGIKGLRYYNGERIPGKKYDYVIFDENDIKITAVRDASTLWKDFTPYHDPSASFSVIGPHAATWDQYRERAFTGRDDGKMRAELDASQASLLLDRPERDTAPLLSLLESFKISSPDSALIGSPRMKLYRDVLETETYARNNGISREEENDIYRELLKEYGFDAAAALTAPDSLSSAIRELTAPCRRIHEELWDMLKNNPLTRNALPDSAPFSAASWNVSEGVFNFLATGENRHLLKALPDAGEWKTYRLGDILSYPELFAAYPSLEDIKITFQNKLPEGASGAFYQRSNTIALRAPSPYAPPSLLLATLLHELQHVIQTMEDYARGGGPSLGTRLYFLPAEKKLHALKAYDYSLSHGFDHLRQAYEIAQTGGAPAEDTELYRQLRREDDTMTAEEKHRFIARLLEDELEQTRYRFSSDMPENTPPSLRFPVEQITLPPAQEALTDRGQSIQQALTLAESLHAPIRAALRETEHHYRELLDNFEKKGGAPGAYLRLAGEIEARNVQHRMDKRAQERAAEPFNSTLEYPGEALVSFALAPGSPDAAFSLTSLHQIVSTLTAPSLQATRAAALVKDFDKAAENWKRVMSGKQDRPSARIGAELFGTINALLSSARYVLPPGYRSQVDMQMQWASIYAAMAESGEIPPKGTLRTGEVFYENFERSMINQTTTAATEQEVRETLAAIGGQRLDHVMSKILDRVRGQLIYFAKDELFRKTMKRVEAVYPKKEPGRKSPRGRMEARAYRTLARCRQMLAANAQEKAEAMTALEALYNKEEDEDKRETYEKDLLAWKTYGDYKGMSLPQAQEAMKKLLEFLLAGRNSWDHKLKKERGGAKFQARQIQKNLPEANSTSTRAGAKIEHHTKLRKLLASLPYSFMSYAQLMLALEPILGQRFSRTRIREITEANAALLNASNDRSAWLFDTISRITGVKSESAAEQWMVRFNRPENTKIPLAPVLTVKITLPIEEAQAWLSLTREERDARRQEIRAEDQRTETLTENVPEEEDILHLRMALDEYERRSPARRQYQQNITSQREVPNKAGSGPLICSRDCALYALLLHEQPDYADVYDDEGILIRKGFLRREGLDDAGIAALYDYVGPDGLEYGYALRKRLNETGQTLAQVYEQRMGVPFTLKEKYFRATFDRNSTKEKDTLAEPRTGAIGGGKYGLLIDRVVHSENLDLSKSGTLVFLAAAAEQDNYIYTSHITTAWRALLKDKTLEQKLKQHLGEDMLGKLASWMDLIDGASLENNRAFLNLSRMQGMLQRAFAFSVLAGNGYVLLKQSTAILHGFFAGWVPSAVLERADGARELAHRHISASSYLFHLAASKLGLGDISLAEVAATPYFTARMRGEGAMLAQIGNQMPGQRYSRLEKLPEKAMNLIETVDVKANLLSMHALANAYYAHARALNKANDTPFTDAELRTAALQQVGMTLELGAQPLTKTQKSMNQAAGGILSKLAFVMKSEQLNKIGLMAAEWKTGSARNRVCAAQSWLALGVTSSLLAWLIAWIKGMDDEDDKEKKWKKYAATALLGDLTTIPLAGEGVNYLASLITGERVFADSYARSLIDVQGVARTVKKEYEHVSDKKEMDWDTHFNNLTSLARAAGVGGAFSRSPSAVLSSYGALSLSAATGANISRTAKDLLTTLFRNEDEDRKKKKKKRKRKKSRDE